MEQIKKKMANLKLERDEAVETAEEAKKERKEAESRADQVSISLCYCLDTLSVTHATVFL